MKNPSVEHRDFTWVFQPRRFLYVCLATRPFFALLLEGPGGFGSLDILLLLDLAPLAPFAGLFAGVFGFGLLLPAGGAVGATGAVSVSTSTSFQLVIEKKPPIPTISIDLNTLS
jgi:hypothetical protein